MLSIDAPSCRPAPWQHGAFYRFVPVAEPPVLAEWLRLLAGRLGLLGSIVVAPEGVNGALAGEAAALDAVEAALDTDPRLARLHLQRSACSTRPFGRLKVQCRSELVASGLPAAGTRERIPNVAVAEASTSKAAPMAARPGTGTRVAPTAWRRLIAEPDVVLLDNRNTFEFRLGHFRGARHPEVQHFHGFARYVERHADAWQAAGQRVAMYCTGGIRCEKMSAWMQGLGLTVCQLEGGILNYFHQVPDAERDWRGECFVFDNRIAIDTRLQETATTAEDVYADEADGDWRLARARRLDAAHG